MTNSTIFSEKEINTASQALKKYLDLLKEIEKQIGKDTKALNDFGKKSNIAVDVSARKEQGSQIEAQSKDSVAPEKALEAARKAANDAINPPTATDKKKEEIDNKEKNSLEAIKLLQEQSVADHQLYENAKTAITKKAQDDRNALDRENYIQLFQGGASIASSMMGLMKETKEDDSVAYKRMFQATKAFAIAEASVKMYSAAMTAFDSRLSWPERLAAVATTITMGTQIISSIKSISMAGQAHSGIDFIPREGTWLLDRGERVVDSRTNADLKQFLNQSDNASFGNGVSLSVNVPVTIENGSGNVSAQDANALAGLIKSTVYSVVMNEQRPGGMLNRGAYA